MAQKPTIFDCSLIHLAKFGDRNGQITAVQGGVDVPFSVQRVFYIYDIPAGESRGGHAHLHCHEFIVAGSGAFEVMVDDGHLRKVVTLNQPHMGLHLPPGIWASEYNFSSGAICIVLASHDYDAADYIRDYDEYLESRKHA